MYKRSYRAANERAGKSTKVSKRSFSDDAKRHLADQAYARMGQNPAMNSPSSVGEGSPRLNDEIVTLVVGKDERLFAAHEYVLNRSPWFSSELSKAGCVQNHFSSNQKTICLPGDDAQVISAIIEFLYKSDYSPFLLHDKRTGQWSLDTSVMAAIGPTMPQDSNETITPLNNPKKFVGFNDIATIYHSGVGDLILRDTAVYCAAQRFGMPALQRLALKKQGLQTGIDVATILRSARFAYANTTDGESKLRGHYLTLIIRSRKTFRQSGTMQMEMEKGGTQLFFDLFVAMCHHIEDVATKGQGYPPGGPAGSTSSIDVSVAGLQAPSPAVGKQETSGYLPSPVSTSSTPDVGCSPCRLINAARNKRPDYTGRGF